MMPKVDGLALAREIKALPIIVLSAIDTADSKARLLDEVAERACAPQPVGRPDATTPCEPRATTPARGS
jgi:CheY-like chemotaxis protein